jgi:hypothetical protein
MTAALIVSTVLSRTSGGVLEKFSNNLGHVFGIVNALGIDTQLSAIGDESLRPTDLELLGTKNALEN